MIFTLEGYEGPKLFKVYYSHVSLSSKTINPRTVPIFGFLPNWVVICFSLISFSTAVPPLRIECVRGTRQRTRNSKCAKSTRK